MIPSINIMIGQIGEEKVDSWPVIFLISPKISNFSFLPRITNAEGINSIKITPQTPPDTSNKLVRSFLRSKDIINTGIRAKNVYDNFNLVFIYYCSAL